MDGIHFWRRALICTALAFVIAPNTWAQGPPQSPPRSESSLVCKVYPLGELGNDPSLGPWIAETIPMVIQPGTWNETPSPSKTSYYVPELGTGRDKNSKQPAALRYYAPGKVLVVYHTQTVHKQVDEFLQSLHKTVSQDKTKSAKPSGPPTLVPAGYSVPAVKTFDSASIPKLPYPVPPPLQQPKHLFHFIIRYEGDGIIDTAVAEVTKALMKDSTKEDKEEKTEKSKTEPSGTQLNQLFHIILRYEGDGIIDANVVEFMKALKEQATKEGSGSSSSYPVLPYSGTKRTETSGSLATPFGPVPINPDGTFKRVEIPASLNPTTANSPPVVPSFNTNSGGASLSPASRPKMPPADSPGFPTAPSLPR